MSRKSQLIEVAAQLFASGGFGSVTVQDIAEHAGVTAGAVYRHVSGKDALLDEVLIEATARIRDGLEQIVTGKPDVVAAGALAVARRHAPFVVAYYRQRPWLATVPAPLAAEERWLARWWRQHDAALMSGASPIDSTTRANAAVGVLAAVAGSPPGSMPSSASTMVAAGLQTLITTPAGASDGSGSRRAASWAAPVGRRQQIIDAAIELFAAHGYDRVSQADVARRAGVAAPTMYEYFATKLDLLLAVYELGGALLTSLRLGVARTAANARAAVAALTDGLTELSFVHRDLIRVNSRAWFWVPPADRGRFELYRREVDEFWVRALRELYPTVTAAQAATLVNCSTWLIHHAAGNGGDSARRRRHVAALAGGFLDSAAGSIRQR